MSYTFDGEQRLIILNPGVRSFSTTDLYSRWKDWVLDGNSQWAFAMRVVGGEPIGAGQFISPYLIVSNGWKIRPDEANQVLNVSGNLVTDDESSPWVPTLGNFNVTINNQVSSNSLTVSTNGSGGPTYTLEQIAQQVWDYNLSNHNTPNSVGNYIRNSLVTFKDWITLKNKI